MPSLLPCGVERDDTGRPDPAQDRDLGLGEARRDGVAEVPDRPAGVLGGEGVQVLGRARLGHLDDRAPDLEVAEGLARVVAEERDPRIAAHVPLLGEATHRVDPHALAVEIAPHDRGLRMAIGHDRGEGGDRRALDEVAVGRRDLVGRVIAEQADGSRRRHLPAVGAARRGSLSEPGDLHRVAILIPGSTESA
jgi:hypothetical protein